MSLYQLDKDQCAAIEAERKKFPAEQARSSIMAALKIVQAQTGWLESKHLQAVAAHLGVPVIEVSEVATFYTMFHLKPVGRFVIKVCDSISCHLCGSHQLLTDLEQYLEIKMGQTTADGMFTLGEAECLAACTQAPVMIINDRDYHYHMDIEKAKDLIKQLTAQAAGDMEAS